MSIEADCFSVRRLRDDVLVKSDRILPGVSETLPYLRTVQILATCSIDNSSGTVRLKTRIRRSRKLSVVLFESPDDLDGQTIPYDQPIKITGDQKLSIFHKIEKREVVIYLNKETSSKDRTPPVDVDRLVPVA